VREMARQNDYKIVDTIISVLKEEDAEITYEVLSKKTLIKSNSLKKWLKIIDLIQNNSTTFYITETGVSKSPLGKLGDTTTTIRTKIKKRDYDPSLQEFLEEFKGVLEKTRISIEDEKRKNYPQLNARPKFPKKLSSEYIDMQAELTTVLEQGFSFLSSSEKMNEQKASKSEGGFLQELKQAVNLGIDNLEKVVVNDYKEKRGRVNVMKSELELVFESRKKRLEGKNNG
jgi:hypothetical protein